jgi:hypothetical protein
VGRLFLTNKDSWEGTKEKNAREHRENTLSPQCRQLCHLSDCRAMVLAVNDKNILKGITLACLP